MSGIDPVPTPVGAAGILYLNGGRVLLLLRGPDSGDYPNTWGFPAGKIELGESPLLAALRESQEEVRFAPQEAAPLLELDGFALFLARDTFAPVLNGESSGFAWAPVDALPQPLHPGVAGAVTLAVAQCAPAPAAMDEREIDTNGWFEVKDNPISKVGVFEYRGAQIPGAPDPNKMYRVFRPAEELGDPETISSFRLLPWIDNHAMLGKGDGLVPAERKGVHGVIGEDVHFRDDTLYGNIKAFSNSLADLIGAGKRELSCGFRCSYEWAPGVWNGQPYDVVQRQIRGNHVALVKRGRMGPDVAVLDHSDADILIFTCDSTEVKMSEENTNSGGESAATEGASLQEVRAQFADFLSKLDDTLKLAAALKGVLGDGSTATEAGEDDDTGAGGGGEVIDSEWGARKSEDEKKEGTTEGVAKDADGEPKKGDAMDEAAIMRAVSTRIAARDRLVGRLSKHVGTFDASAMDEQDVAAYGVKKLGLKGIPKGHEVTALDIYLTTAKAPSERATTAAMDTAATGDAWLSKQRAALGRR